MIKYIRYSKEKSMACNLQVCGFMCLYVCRCVCVCVFCRMYVIVGVRDDIFLCLCVFMLCVFVSVHSCINEGTHTRRDVCVLSSSVYLSDEPLHGWSLLAPSGRVPACILVVCAAPFFLASVRWGILVVCDAPPFGFPTHRPRV